MVILLHPEIMKVLDLSFMTAGCIRQKQLFQAIICITGFFIKSMGKHLFEGDNRMILSDKTMRQLLKDKKLIEPLLRWMIQIQLKAPSMPSPPIWSIKAPSGTLPLSVWCS